MDILDEYRNIIKRILQYYADLPYSYGDVKTSVFISQEQNQFLLIDESWQNGLRVYGIVVHVEIRNEKIWIQRDGIEDGITEELLEAEIPKDKIILAFHPPEVRQYTEFAVN